jgi:hypothetical protein
VNFLQEQMMKNPDLPPQTAHSINQTDSPEVQQATEFLLAMLIQQAICRNAPTKLLAEQPFGLACIDPTCEVAYTILEMNYPDAGSTAFVNAIRHANPLMTDFRVVRVFGPYPVDHQLAMRRAEIAERFEEHRPQMVAMGEVSRRRSEQLRNAAAQAVESEAACVAGPVPHSN